MLFIGDSMEIINYQHSDLESLRQLYFESRLNTFTWLDNTEFELNNFDRDSKGEQIWVAKNAGEIVGFISIWKPECFIHNLFVSPHHLRNGVGSTLLDFSKQHYSVLSLKCLIENKNAVDFYQSQGFKIATTVKNGSESYHLMTFENNRNLPYR
jgi:ribosomal protein S18 acetylase RimI-like enzyme